MLQAALPNGFRLRMLPRSVPAVFRQTGEIFYIGGTDVLPAPLEGQEEADAIAGLSDPENETARSELIEHNLRLVVYIAQKFDNTGVGVEDLISIGTIGLIKAIDSFNIEQGARFATYAGKCLQNEILMHFRSQKKLTYENSLNDSVDVDKDGNPLTYLDILCTEDDIVEELDLKIKSDLLYKAVREALNERERTIIALRYGMNKLHKPMPQREVAKRLNISRSYVSRIEKCAVDKIRAYMKA